MRRRDFIAGLGAAAWPAVVAAQQRALPVIGFLALGANNSKGWGSAFQQGLKDAGYVEGQNVAIEYRGYAGTPSPDRLTELATEYVRQQVAAILTSNDGPALAAKRATSTIPIIFFNIGSDLVKLGLVASINRPGGNVTGFINEEREMGGKWLALLREVAPRLTRAAIIVQPRNGAWWRNIFPGLV